MLTFASNVCAGAVERGGGVEKVLGVAVVCKAAFYELVSLPFWPIRKAVFLARTTVLFVVVGGWLDL